MARISVYYEFHDERMAPMWMVVKFKPGEMDWQRSYIHIPLEAPFKRHIAEDFHPDTMSLSIAAEDIVLTDRTNQFSIYIPHVLKRMEKFKMENNIDFHYGDVEQFIIQMSDIEEMMQMNVKPFYEWRTS